MYSRFEELCLENNVTPTFVAREAGVPQATVSDWKRGLYTPKVDKMIKLANYFGVSVEEFIKEK